MTTVFSTRGIEKQRSLKCVSHTEKHLIPQLALNCMTCDHRRSCDLRSNRRSCDVRSNRNLRANLINVQSLLNPFRNLILNRTMFLIDFEFQSVSQIYLESKNIDLGCKSNFGSPSTSHNANVHNEFHNYRWQRGAVHKKNSIASGNVV